MEAELSKSLDQLINKLVKKTENQMRAILTNKGKADSRLMKTVRLKVTKTNTGYSIETKMPDYAIYVDRGRKPGKQPPLKAIQDWCKRKNIEIKAAYPIAKKIARTGIKGTGFMNPLFQLRVLLLNQIGKTLTQQFMATIKEFKKVSKY